MEENDVIEVENYTFRKKFNDLFHLHEHQDLPIKCNKIEKLTPVYDLHFEKYDIDIEITPLTFRFNIIISEFEKENNIRKLQLEVREETFKEELQPCLNHLQRRRNLHYAIDQLLSFKRLFQERAKIMEYSAQRLPNCLNVDYEPINGFVINCFDPITKDPQFNAKWKIWWNCRNFNFFDYIEFEINTSFEVFHQKVRLVMMTLLFPIEKYETKLAAWTKIYDYVEENLSINRLMNSFKNISVASNEHSFDIVSRPIEVIDLESDEESDDDDCVVESIMKSNNNNILIID